MPSVETEHAATGGMRLAGAGARRQLPRRLGWAIALCVLAMLWQPAAGFADTLFESLRGSWSGTGQIRYDDGQAERIRCTAYYTGEGVQLRLAIRCESPSTKVEIRGYLNAHGDKLAGTWEERTFNASGEASGRVAADKMSLSINGGGFRGSMSVSTTGSRQAVTISTEGIKMKSVSITLGKS